MLPLKIIFHLKVENDSDSRMANKMATLRQVPMSPAARSSKQLEITGEVGDNMNSYSMLCQSP